jgi:hypothetical protein
VNLSLRPLDYDTLGVYAVTGREHITKFSLSAPAWVLRLTGFQPGETRALARTQLLTRMVKPCHWLSRWAKDGALMRPKGIALRGSLLQLSGGT